MLFLSCSTFWNKIPITNGDLQTWRDSVAQLYYAYEMLVDYLHILSENQVPDILPSDMLHENICFNFLSLNHCIICSSHGINYFALNGFTTTGIFIWVVPTVIHPIAYLLRLQAYSVISASMRSCGWAKKFLWKEEKRSSSFGYTDLWRTIFLLSSFYFLPLQIHDLPFWNISYCGHCLHAAIRKMCDKRSYDPSYLY